MLLSGSQIINNVTEICINLIVVFKIFIHLVSFLLQSGNFHFPRSNVTLKFFNLIIEHELEFLQLLSLLLKLIYLLLAVTNQFIFSTYFCCLILYLLLQGIQSIKLTVYQDTLFLAVTFELVDVRFDVLVLVLRQLQLSFRF